MLALTTQVKSLNFLSERQIAQKESFQSIFPPKAHRNTHDEGKRWETYLAFKDFALLCAFFLCGSGDLWIEFAHSNQPWFASYVGKQHWTNNEPQNRKKKLWPWNEPSLCSSVRLSQIVVWYTATGLYITLHSSSARLEGIHPVHIQLIGDSGFGIHLITAVSVIKRLILYEFTLWGQDSTSVIRIRESPYYRAFLRKYMTILSRRWKLFVIERCPYREVPLYFFSSSILFPLVLFYFLNMYWKSY